jgi:hypothetical protein
MWRVGPRLVGAGSFQMSSAVAAGEVLDHTERSRQACPGRQRALRLRRSRLPDQCIGIAAELHRNYIPAAQMGERTSQNCGAWRHAWVAENRSRCAPQRSQTNFSTVPYGRICCPPVQSAACGMVVVGFPSKPSQSLHRCIGDPSALKRKSAKTSSAPCGVSRQFAAPYLSWRSSTARMTTARRNRGLSAQSETAHSDAGLGSPPPGMQVGVVWRGRSATPWETLMARPRSDAHDAG